MIEKDWLFQQYYDSLRSFQDIADELGTNKQKVRRTLLKMGGKPRGKDEAQSCALKSGRATHPTAGTKRPKEVRLKISDKMAQHWEEMSEDELKRRSDDARKRWEALPEWKKDEIHQLAGNAMREASKEGSKLEKILYDALLEAGMNVQYHVENLIPNVKMQIDMLVASHRTVVEIDGPSHFLPLWGEEKLQKTIRADYEKNGMLILSGFVVLRIKQLSDTISLSRQQYIIDTIVNKLNEIEQNFPPQDQRLIEIEV